MAFREREISHFVAFGLGLRLGENQFWFSCSPFVQVSSLVQVRRKEEKEAKRRLQEDQG